MKRVIRLTESDLVRIVKRVINEQTQETEMMPVSYTVLNRNQDSITTFDSQNRPNKFIVKPSIATYQDNKGNSIPDPNRLRLVVSTQNIPNAVGVLEIDCKNKTSKATESRFSTTDQNFCVNVSGIGDRCGDKASNLMNQAYKSGTSWGYSGAIKEMGDKYCKA